MNRLLRSVDARLLTVLTLFAALVLYRHLSFPAPVPAPDAGRSFSAERALAHLTAIGQAPRRLHHPYYEESRDYVIAQLKALGIASEVQETTAHHASASVFFSSVRNVVARIDGSSDSNDAVLLVGHLDSEPFVSPGVTDDAAAVAVMLEVARAITAGPKLAHPIILLFTSPEESATEGAVAFVTEHRWAKTVRVAINLDGLGTGRMVLLSTASENGWLIRQLATAAPTMMAHSPITLVTANPPTDYGQALKPAGVAGFDLTTLKTSMSGAYQHSRLDDLSQVRLPDLQDQGRNVLSLARHLGNADLGQVRDADRIYFAVLNRVILQYPRSWSVPLAAALMLLLVVVLVVGRRKRLVTPAGVATAMLGVAGSIVGTLVGTSLLWRALSRWHPLYQFSFNQTEYYRLPLFIACAGIAALATLGSFVAVARTRRVTLPDVVTGIAATTSLAGAAGTFVAPEIAYFLVLATMSLLLATLVWFLAPDRARGHGAVPWAILYGAAGVVGLALTFPLVLTSFGTSPSDPLRHLVVVAVFVLLMPAAYHAVIRHTRLLLGLAGSVALLPLLFAASRGFSAERPRVAAVWLVHDADRGRSFWVARNLYRGPLDEYTAQFVGASSKAQSIREFVPDYPADYRAHIAPAKVQAPVAPTLTVLGDSVADGIRTLRLRVGTRRDAYEITGFRNPDLALVDYRVNGLEPKPLFGRTAEATDSTVLFHFRNAPSGGFELQLRVRADAPVVIKLRDRSYGLPVDAGTRTMPDDMIPWVDYGGGSVLAIKTFRW